MFIYARKRKVSRNLVTYLHTLFTQRNFAADFLREKCSFSQKKAILHF